MRNMHLAPSHAATPPSSAKSPNLSTITPDPLSFCHNATKPPPQTPKDALLSLLPADRATYCRCGKNGAGAISTEAAIPISRVLLVRGATRA